jgi:ATP-dependent Clp protease ATP-binding subunit ClpC
MPLPHFDSRAKNALAIAQQIAIQMNHSRIGSEHLLFGILSQPQDGLPFQISFIENISNQELLDIIAKQGLEKFQTDLPDVNKKQNSNFLPEITPELQDCLDAAIKSAEDFSYDYIGLEHLVFGILEIPESHGKKIIGLTEPASHKLREILLNIFNNYGKKTTEADDKTNLTNKKKISKNQSALSYFTTDMNKKIEAEKDFKLVEREKEIDRIIQVLSRKNKNNPIILGEPGVGKTALVEGLAHRINLGQVPTWLLNKRVMNLDVGGLLAGAMFRGEFEQRVKIIIDEVIAAKDTVLFIDELHTVVGAGNSSQGGPDLASIIKPALSRGELSIIGATTEDEYRTIIKKDKAFERRFQPIRLEQPNLQETTNILRGIKTMYENHHGVTLPDELIFPLVDLADRFLSDRFFPDKAIDIMDECMVRARLKTFEENGGATVSENDWAMIEKEILTLIKRKNDAILSNNSDLSQQFEKEQKVLEEKLAELNIKNKELKKTVYVTQEMLDKVVSEMSNVPLVRVSSNIYTKIKELDTALSTQIFGQEEAITQVSKSLKRSYAGVNPNKGPIASFLLLGPTGVGKTELVKLVTTELYGDLNKYLLKIDMSELRERHQMSRLLGAPAGYVGYEDAPQLTEFLRKKPYSVILFDEIEKGHPDNLNILLQMLEEGKITDAKGNSVSCEHALIFLTSNLGKSQLNKFASKLGFTDMAVKDEHDYEEIKKQVMEQVEKSIKPEILGRLTSKIVFRPITQTILKQVINKELALVQKHLLKQGRRANFKPTVVDLVYLKANEKIEYGAREVKALVASIVQDEIAEFILDNPECMNITIKVEENKIVVEPTKETKKPSLKKLKEKMLEKVV